MVVIAQSLAPRLVSALRRSPICPAPSDEWIDLLVPDVSGNLMTVRGINNGASLPAMGGDVYSEALSLGRIRAVIESPIQDQSRCFDVSREIESRSRPELRAFSARLFNDRSRNAACPTSLFLQNRSNRRGRISEQCPLLIDHGQPRGS